MHLLLPTSAFGDNRSELTNHFGNILVCGSGSRLALEGNGA